MYIVKFVIEENPLENYSFWNQFGGTLWENRSQRWKESHTLLIDEVWWRKIPFLNHLEPSFAWSSKEFLWERERREKEQQLSFLGIMGDRFRLIRFKVFLDVINKLK